MPLSNAERQRRHRQRRRQVETAETGAAVAGTVSQGPARGYSWPPFEAGNLAAVKSGIQSPRLLTPRAEEILLRERGKPTWPAYLQEPVYERAVRAWARAEAMLEMYGEYIEQQSAEAMSTEFGEAEEDVTGYGTKGGGGSSARRSRTRKTGPSLEMWRKLDAAASMHRTKLGLDPLARARLGRDVASSQADMAQIMAQMDREEHISGHVQEVWTDLKRKQAGFSVLKSAMGAGTLILPRDPDLMRELAHLDYERTPAGSMRIAARQGSHDDRAMSLLQAASCMRHMTNPAATDWHPEYPHTITGRGTVMPSKPRPVEYQTSFFRSAAGLERGTEPAW